VASCVQRGESRYAASTLTGLVQGVHMPKSICAEMVASVHSIEIEVGATVIAGETLLILESMKMEIPVLADIAGTVQEIGVAVGDVVNEGDILVVLA